MKRLVYFLCVLFLAACSPKEYSALKVEFDSYVNGLDKVSDLIYERVGERVPIKGHDTLYVTLSVDSSINPDHARVRVAGNQAVISSSSVRGIIFGSGKLLRAMTYTQTGFKVENGNYDFSPAQKSLYRCCYMARHFNTWYHRAPKEELLRYMDDMFLLGINAFNTQLVPNHVDSEYTTDADIAVFNETTNAVCDRIRQYGMYLQVGGGGNKGHAGFPPQFKAQKLVPPRGDDSWNICPNAPGALEYLLENREKVLKKYVAHGYPITNMAYFPYDEGGCQCDKCAPWGGNGYVKVIEAMHELNMRYFPEVKETVSCWFFDDKDFEGLWKWLDTQNWVDYLEIDSHSDFPSYPLEHKVPKNIAINTFPEISMWGRCPWGGYGATALPARFERLYRQVENIAGGFRLYSEGLYDDVNKFVITRLYTEPNLSYKEILKEYARYELPGVDSKTFIEFIDLLESIHPTGKLNGERRKDFNFLIFLRDGDPQILAERKAQAAKALELALKMDSQILPSMKECWRWRQLRLRAIIDNEIYSTGKLHTEVSDKCYRELVEMYHGQNQLKRLLEDHKDGYTLPPFLPQVQMPAPEGSDIYDGWTFDSGI